MSVDKFGRYSNLNKISQGPQGIQGVGFYQTRNGDFDLQNKRMINLKEPVETKDAVTKHYIDKEITKVSDINMELTASCEYIDKKLDKIALSINELNKNTVNKIAMREYVMLNLDRMQNWVCETFEKSGINLEKTMRNRSPWSPSLPGISIQKESRTPIQITPVYE